MLTILCCGAVLGSIFDGFHTHGGVTAYPHPLVLGMAWWTPLVFGAAALGIALTHVRLDQVWGRPARPLTGWAAAAGLGYFGCFYFLSGFWRVSNGAKLAALVAGFVVLFAILDRTWQGALLALLTALCGCAVEVVLTGLGAFTHLTADRWGIPLWLPGLYLLASLSIGNLGRLLLVLSLCPICLLGCGPPGLAAAASQPPAQRVAQSTPVVRDDTSPVQLVYTDVYDNGCPTCTVARGFALVSNLAYQKQVALVYSLDGGPFQEFDTWFRATIDSQREIWWFQLGFSSALRFALRYTVAGQQYWDDNGGQDYQVSVDPMTGAVTEAALGAARDVALTSAAVPGLDNPSELDVSMFVRDLDYQKDVVVVYSADGWATTQTATVQFQQGLDGVERWAARAPLSGGDPTRIDFAVAATQAGGTQWDDNFGQNFSCILCQSRSCQDWVCTAPTLP